MDEKRVRLPDMPGLDGMRAISVLAVFFYHAGMPWAAGGFLGVESFFVISGYLITSLLLKEWWRDGAISLRRFWLRRARRLLPALWLLLLVSPTLALVWAPDAWARLKEDLLAALVYITNWVYIVREIPYFEQFGRPPLLQHLWSLALEEQFYILWPLILVGLVMLLRATGPERAARLLPAILLGVAVSTALMLLLHDPRQDAVRVYYGTDTRAAGFLIGAALAAVWRPGDLPRVSARVVDAVGWIALGGLVWLFVSLSEFSSMLYQGGFLLTAVTTAVVLAVASHPATTLGAILGRPLMRWLGNRSYAIYLWHWPLMSIYRLGFESALTVPLYLTLMLVVILAVSELSYRLLEDPIRQRGFRAWGRSAMAQWQRLPQPGRLGVSIAAGILLVAGSAGSISLLELNSPGTTPEVLAALPTATPSPIPVPPTPAATPTALPATPTTPGLPAVSTIARTPSSTPTLRPTRTPAPTGTIPALLFTLIGDSVMQGTLPLLEPALGERAYIDTERKRLMEDVPDLLGKLSADQLLATTVVIHLGTNRPFEPPVFDEVMLALTSFDVERVIFLNVSRPSRWESLINTRFAEGVARWNKAELLDWNALSKSKSGWFIEDRVHLTYVGSEAYVAAILAALGVD